jgi:hypothetical protein
MIDKLIYIYIYKFINLKISKKENLKKNSKKLMIRNSKNIYRYEENDVGHKDHMISNLKKELYEIKDIEHDFIRLND